MVHVRKGITPNPLIYKIGLEYIDYRSIGDVCGNLKLDDNSVIQALTIIRNGDSIKYIRAGIIPQNFKTTGVAKSTIGRIIRIFHQNKILFYQRSISQGYAFPLFELKLIENTNLDQLTPDIQERQKFRTISLPKRQEIIRLHKDNRNANVIAKEIGCARMSVIAIISRFKKCGLLTPGFRKRTELNDFQKQFITQSHQQNKYISLYEPKKSKILHNVSLNTIREFRQTMKP
uniref:Helix-turn-helix domain-containing protein n=1 Tax=Rhabditophanes sp. KR3021 TaxID=114890 RepID=A0AC35TGA1_9BILA